MPVTRSKAKTMQQSMHETVAVSDTEQSPKKRKQTTITSTGQLNYSSVVVQDHNETTTSSTSSTWSETRTSCGDKRKRPCGNGGSSGMKSSSSNGCLLASGMKSSSPDGSSSEPWGSTQNFRPENPNPDDPEQGSPLWTMTLPYRLKNGWPFIDDVGVQGSNSGDIDVLPSAPAIGLRSSNSNNSDKTKSAASALIKAVTKTSLPSPYGKPVVWAENRQDLCSALPYYRAYQSGAYTSKNIAYGILIDKDSGARSHMDEEVIITRAGGHCKQAATGGLIQVSDQSSDSANVSSFLNNKRLQVPVGVIVGSLNEDCPSAIPYRYCVLDWFQVTNVWAEKVNDKVSYKFRFEKIDLTTKSWWAPEGSPLLTSDRDFSQKAQVVCCGMCLNDSKKIFEQGWMCLSPDCVVFWKLDGQDPSANLSYSKEFLQERTQWPEMIKPPFDLKPVPLADNFGNPFSYSNWKGMVCPNCGRCNTRNLWTRWQCRAVGCGFEHGGTTVPVPISAVLPDYEGNDGGHALPQDEHSAPVVLRDPVFLGFWRIHIYDLLKGNKIAHFHSNCKINQEADGPNAMFRSLQEADINLKRFPLQSAQVQGEMHTKHFSTNFGMPYKYIVAVESKPFKNAPQVAINAMDRLRWAGKYMVDDGSYQESNELLVLGYFEGQSIGYHDDGEADLGPTIATLSIGGQATMNLRMKAKYYCARRVDFSKKQRLVVLEGCQLYEERLKLNRLLEQGTDSEYVEAMKVFKKHANQEKRKQAPVCLSMRLKHGDMVVMHGSETQLYYEHSVEPEGKLRFALTSRYIKPENIPVTEHWKGELHIDPSKAYNGGVQSSDLDQPDCSQIREGDSTPYIDA